MTNLEAQIRTMSSTRRRSGWRSRWAAIGAGIAVTVGAGSGMYYVSAAPGDVVANSFVSLAPVRIMDTRPAPDNVGGFVGPLGSDQVHSFQVTGVAGVPANAVSVVMNVTVTGTSAPSFLTLYPAGASRPTASNLNWTAGGITVPNLVTVAVGAAGKVSVYNLQGSAHVIADIAGYYVPGNDKFVSLDIFGGSDVDTATFSGGFGANAGLQFLDGASNASSFHVVLPPDYTPGTTIVGTFTWHVAAVSCAVEWRASYTSVSRAGQLHVTGLAASSGMSSPGASPQGTTSNMVNSATFTLTSPNAGFTLMPGDSYTFSLFRSGTAVTDTCAQTAKIDSMILRYD